MAFGLLDKDLTAVRVCRLQDDWAIDSNDKSPNEHHHLSAAFRILRQPECNFMHRMPHHQQQALRKMVRMRVSQDVLPFPCVTPMLAAAAVSTRTKDSVRWIRERGQRGRA